MATTKPATYFYDAQLIAKERGNFLRLGKDGKFAIFKPFKNGDYLGNIDYHIVRDGKIYWAIAGTNPILYIQHGAAKMDASVIQKTASGVKHEKRITEMKNAGRNPVTDLVGGVGSLFSGVGTSLGFLGQNLKLILILGLVLVVAYTINKI